MREDHGMRVAARETARLLALRYAIEIIPARRGVDSSGTRPAAPADHPIVKRIRLGSRTMFKG